MRDAEDAEAADDADILLSHVRVLRVVSVVRSLFAEQQPPHEFERC